MNYFKIAFLLVLGLLSAKEGRLQEAAGIYYSKDSGQSWNADAQGLPAGVLVNEFMSFQGKIFAATNDHGLFVSKEGEHWESIGKNLPLKIKALARNGNTLYAAPWLAGIRVSFNQGKSWQERNFGLFDQEVMAIATYDNLVFLGTGTGIFLSWDDGLTWMNVMSGVQVNHLAVHGNSIYAATPLGIFQSDDRGKTWKNTLEGVEIRTVQSMNKTVYALTYDEGILMKNNQDSSWTGINEGLPNNGYSSFALSVLDDSLWVACMGSIYELKPGAKSWQKRKFPRGEKIPVTKIFEHNLKTILVVLNGQC